MEDEFDALDDDEESTDVVEVELEAEAVMLISDVEVDELDVVVVEVEESVWHRNGPRSVNIHTDIVFLQ